MNNPKPVDTKVSLGPDPLAHMLLPLSNPPSTPLVPVQPVQTSLTEFKALPPIPERALGPNGRQIVDAALRQFAQHPLTSEQVILLGSEVHRKLGSHIDELLDQVSHEEASVLVELFDRLAKGIEDADLNEVERSVKSGDKQWFFFPLTDKLRITNPVRRAKQFAGEVRDMLTTKTATLKSLIAGMENEALEEVGRLMRSLTQINAMANGYLSVVEEFAIATTIAQELQKKAEIDLAELTAHAEESGDPRTAVEVREAQMVLEEIRARYLALRISYEKIPADLELLGRAKGSASTILAETANGIQHEFNELKSALVQWHLLLTQRDLLVVNEKRRRVTRQIQDHALNSLEQVATTAAGIQGENRLEDAQRLLQFGQKLSGLRERIQTIQNQKDGQFRQAETALSHAREIFVALPAPNAQQLPLVAGEIIVEAEE